MPLLVVNQPGMRRVLKALGDPPNAAIALRMGIDAATVSRVLSGKAAPGNRFVAGALYAFGPAHFHSIFKLAHK